jgi:hypothetical protein
VPEVVRASFIPLACIVHVSRMLPSRHCGTVASHSRSGYELSLPYRFCSLSRAFF